MVGGMDLFGASFEHCIIASSAERSASFWEG
jgi:hypothetical protein